TVTAMVKISDSKTAPIGEGLEGAYIIAWTTTPWTLPANTALTVGPKIEYVTVKTCNQYTFLPITIIVAKDLAEKQFNKKFTKVENEENLKPLQQGDKIPYFIGASFPGKDLVVIKYEQLMPSVQPFQNPENAFRVIAGDFVTTDDGTGIVHTSPTFGADD